MSRCRPHPVPPGERLCRRACFVSDHGLLLRILEDGSQGGDGPFVLHLSQAVGQLMLEQGRVVLEGPTDPLYGISPWHRAQRQSAHTTASLELPKAGFQGCE